MGRMVNIDNVFSKDVIGNVRKAQEDSCDFRLSTPNGSLFVVCDGMGGHVGGKVASSIAVKCIVEYLSREPYADIREALRAALEFANIQIICHANENPELRGMGTTACIVLIKDNVAYIAHIGDSRIYLYLYKERELHRITKDHSFVQALVDAGEITADEAETHPDKNRILKALGIRTDITPTVGVVYPKKDDIFLICSDGLSDMLSDYEIKNIFDAKVGLAQTGETLIDEALLAGGKDNTTVQLIRIASGSAKKSQFISYNPAFKNAPKSFRAVSAPMASAIPPAKAKSNNRRLIAPILVALVAVALGVVTYLFVFAEKSAPKPIQSEKPYSENEEDIIEEKKNQMAMLKITADSITLDYDYIERIFDRNNNEGSMMGLVDAYIKEPTEDKLSPVAGFVIKAITCEIPGKLSGVDTTNIENSVKFYLDIRRSIEAK